MISPTGRLRRRVAKTVAQLRERFEFARTARQLRATYSDVPRSYEIVVFSKDRPMQLHALLTSFLVMSKSKPTIRVLYRASTPEYEAGYSTCFTLVPAGKQISVFSQSADNSFRNDLLEIFKTLNASRIVLLVDDIVFVRKFNLCDLDDFDLRKVVPSLRLGRSIRKSYTTGAALRLPDTLEGRGRWLTWNWKGNDLDWSYPLSVDGHVFLRSDLAAMLPRLSFHSPNTLEAELQRFKSLYESRQGLCYELPRLVNLPLNRVQDDFDNRHGSISAPFLLKKWTEGYRIDVESLAALETDSAHVEAQIRFVPWKDG
jgi:hypothetical protein